MQQQPLNPKLHSPNTTRTSAFVSVILVFCLGFLGAYIVKKGDTLWDLSDEFLQDPFLWPDIWHNNPHIQNPHLIYPGDSLSIQGTTASEDLSDFHSPYIPDSLLPESVKNSQSSGDRSAQFANKLGGLQSKQSVYRNIQQSKMQFVPAQQSQLAHINTYFQIHAPAISKEYSPAWGTWLDIQDGEKKPNLRSRPGDEILINAGKTSTTLKKDQYVFLFTTEELELFISESSSPVKHYVHTLAAIARVQEVGHKKTRAHLTHVYTSFFAGNARASERFSRSLIQVKSYESVQSVNYKSLAEVVWLAKDAISFHNHGYAILNRGSAAGYATGDALAIWENSFIDESLPPRLLARGIVLNTELNFSVILIQNLNEPIRPLKTGELASISYKAIPK
jgi:hypothetical protein